MTDYGIEESAVDFAALRDALLPKLLSGEVQLRGMSFPHDGVPT